MRIRVSLAARGALLAFSAVGPAGVPAELWGQPDTCDG
jgi:hypothetical protein